MGKIKALFKSKLTKWLAMACGGVVLFFLLLYGGVYVGVFGKLPSKEALGALKQEKATQVLDKNGTLIGKYYIYDRQPLAYKAFPKHLIDALIATEDVRFYEHNGIDGKSLLRVFFKNILMGDASAGGGSTITLQLAKNLYGRQQYALFGVLINKFKEAAVARRLEAVYSKKELLTLYLNTVPFPDNTYGIESASQKFFNKTASALTVSEAATLIGTLKANSYYNPRKYLKRSEARRNVVLDQMVNYSFMDKAEAEKIKQDSLTLDYHSFNHDVGLAPYFRAQVKKEVSQILKDHKKPNGNRYDLYRDGLVIHTTLDATMQQYAEAAMREHLKALQKRYEASYGEAAPWQNKDFLIQTLKKTPAFRQLKSKGLSDAAVMDTLAIKRELNVFNWDETPTQSMSVIDSLSHYLKFLNTGMLSVEPATGAIRTYIGGVDYRYFKYDHVSQSQRQVGSTFKPFVYTSAIESGIKPCKYYTLEAITYTNYDNWKPTNSGEAPENAKHLNYSLEKALSQSVNTIAVKVLHDVGISKVIAQAQKMGLKTELPAEPSLALGTAEITIKELAGAYASFVNESRPVTPYMISKIEDQRGDEIVAFKPEINQEKAFTDYTRQVMMQFMQATVNSGTAHRLQSVYGLQNAIAGKTGTTQDNKDGWFVGITPNLVAVTWVGNDDYNIGFKTTGLGQGANSALPIFAKFYQKLNRDSAFNAITRAAFETPDKDVLNDLDCQPEKEDGFFKRLFKSNKKTKEFKAN
ncbi:penicillin-binding protein [Mangrovimonas yunxiaonensis]|uniref:Penicillin-binding protein n=1 Tax=Mangrovimonas yunxiaonensis TaxID=1197477 RepID=A0A084TL60_9FLAO|nr:transglycosylase domain-containing protein [Mangrovimonas yunxiaonensis]KFB01446.1 penicillin-binding protein [Mangrovimonas yunxiaonensis]GGH36617.1 penicillin-binding protein 1A [Mangrovimonas yunxiaonensis]